MSNAVSASLEQCCLRHPGTMVDFRSYGTTWHLKSELAQPCGCQRTETPAVHVLASETSLDKRPILGAVLW